MRFPSVCADSSTRDNDLDCRLLFRRRLNLIDPGMHLPDAISMTNRFKGIKGGAQLRSCEKRAQALP
jgi:hypothetical protein